MRIGYFGGSFDPPHNGHLAVARAARDGFALDRVLLAPTARQPLKPNGPHASWPDRLRMTELLCQGEPGLEASAIDGPQPNGQPNYTADTLRRLHAGLASAPLFACHPRRGSASPGCHSRRESASPASKLHEPMSSEPEPIAPPYRDLLQTASSRPEPTASPSAEWRDPQFRQPAPHIFAILGADAFLSLPQWREPEELLRLADWIVVSRPGFTMPQPTPDLLSPGRQTHIHPLEGIANPITATALRHRLSRADSCEDALPAPVRGYIAAHGLYRA